MLSEQEAQLFFLWCRPLISTLGRQGQVDLCEFKTGLVYRVSLRPDRATLRHCLKKLKKKKSFSIRHNCVCEFARAASKVGDEASRKKMRAEFWDTEVY